ncbi:MAG: hypothetical protein ABSB61_01930 [Anaerolineales bacterium]
MSKDRTRVLGGSGPSILAGIRRQGVAGGLSMPLLQFDLLAA